MTTPTCCTGLPEPDERAAEALCRQLGPALCYDLGLADTLPARERPSTVALRGEFDLFWW